MRLLLDTHSLIWSLFAPDKLSKRARSAILDPENDAMVSVVTFWEISLKYALGKIEIKGLNPEDLPASAKEAFFEIIQLEPEEAASFHRLPRLGHKDPFDRLMIWQAIKRDFFLISADRQFSEYQKYGLKLLW
jgi:PIN domain nuclease of toxin-antitoxin system